jgi:hypothetical protein
MRHHHSDGPSVQESRVACVPNVSAASIRDRRARDVHTQPHTLPEAMTT